MPAFGTTYAKRAGDRLAAPRSDRLPNSMRSADSSRTVPRRRISRSARRHSVREANHGDRPPYQTMTCYFQRDASELAVVGFTRNYGEVIDYIAVRGDRLEHGLSSSHDDPRRRSP